VHSYSSVPAPCLRSCGRTRALCGHRSAATWTPPARRAAESYPAAFSRSGAMQTSGRPALSPGSPWPTPKDTSPAWRGQRNGIAAQSQVGAMVPAARAVPPPRICRGSGTQSAGGRRVHPIRACQLPRQTRDGHEDGALERSSLTDVCPSCPGRRLGPGRRWICGHSSSRCG